MHIYSLQPEVSRIIIAENDDDPGNISSVAEGELLAGTKVVAVLLLLLLFLCYVIDVFI